MPYTAADAHGKTHIAKSPSAQRQWAHVANGGLARGLSEKEAIMEANGVIKKRMAKSKLHRVTA